MTKTRLEAFSDAVIAIIMTIMVLELAIPEHDGNWNALRGLWPEFLTYLLTFVFLGIYWSNHHHLIHTVKRVNGRILWANLHLLFWLSLATFVTGWLGNNFEAAPLMAYGTVLLMSAIAYYILQGQILATHPPDSPLRVALGADLKGKISPVLYAAAIAIAYLSRWISVALYITVALMWLIPDKRIESVYDELETSAD